MHGLDPCIQAGRPLNGKRKLPSRNPSTVVASSNRPRPTLRNESAGVGRGLPLDAGSSRSEQRQSPRFFRCFELFQGFAGRKTSPPLIRGVRFPADSFWFDETVAAMASACGTSEDYLAGLQFGFFYFQ
jgi:hypothetical protein